MFIINFNTMRPIVLIASILVLVAVVAANPKKVNPQVEEFKRIHDECQADPATKVDHETMEKFYKGESIDEVKFGKHILCMNIKMGVQNEHGDIDKEALKKGLGPHNEKAQEIADECGEKKGDTAAEAALALAKCYRKHRPAPPRDHAHHH